MLFRSRANGAVRIARPNAQLNPIHEQDIADVALKAILEPGHDGAMYSLTGPESMSQADQAAAIAAAVGKPVHVNEITDDEARADLAKWTTPEIADRMVNGLIARDGVPMPVDHTVSKVLGRPARTYAEWAADHATDFR